MHAVTVTLELERTGSMLDSLKRQTDQIVVHSTHVILLRTGQRQGADTCTAERAFAEFVVGIELRGGGAVDLACVVEQCHFVLATLPSLPFTELGAWQPALALAGTAARYCPRCTFKKCRGARVFDPVQQWLPWTKGTESNQGSPCFRELYRASGATGTDCTPPARQCQWMG